MFLRAPRGAQPQYNAEFKIQVAFDEVEAVAGKPATDVLRKMFVEVEQVLMATEAECRRIGLV